MAHAIDLKQAEFQPIAITETDAAASGSSQPEIDKALGRFRAEYSDIAGLYSAEDFRTPGAKKLIDKIKFDQPETIVKLNAFKKKLDALQKKMRNLLSLQAVRVSDKQFPRIHKLARQAAARLELSNNFNIFILRSPVFNAFTYSYNANDFDVVIHTAALEALSDDAMLALLGHEMGHVKDQAMLTQLILAADFERHSSDTPAASHEPFYDQLFDHLPASMRKHMASYAVELAADAGRNGILAFENEAQASEFSRNCELTADRAAVIVTGNAAAPLKLLSALAYGSKALSEEFSQDELIKQIRAVLANMDSPEDLDYLVQNQESHPFNVLRLIEVTDFAQTKAFKSLTARLDQNAYGQELDIFLRIVTQTADTAARYKKYLAEKADTDDTLVRLKTKDGFEKQLSRLSKSIAELGSLILGQFYNSPLENKDSEVFTQLFTKMKADSDGIFRTLLGPPVEALLKKKLAETPAETAAAAEIQAKLKLVHELLELDKEPTK